jgi:hypothetical protein
MLKSVAAALILALPLTLAAPAEQVSQDVAEQYTNETPEVDEFPLIPEDSDDSTDLTWEYLDEDTTPEIEERDLEARAYNGDITYYYPGLGACGWTNGQNDMIAAVSKIIFTKQNPCGRKIRVKGPKGSVDVKVVDKCMGCTEGSVSDFPQMRELDACVS